MNRLTANYYYGTVELWRKFIACAVLVCIIAGSAEFVTLTGINASLLISDSAKVSADTLLSHFFSLSTLPVNTISKIFTEEVDNLNLKTEKTKKNNNKKEKERSSAKASSAYSIAASYSDFLNFTAQAKSSSIFKDFINILKLKSADYLILDRDKTRCIDLFIKFNIMLLLLYILLTRRNIGGDDNIVNKIKNNMIARLV